MTSSRHWSDVATKQGMLTTSRSQKMQATESPLEPQEGTSPANNPDFSPMNFIWDLLNSRTVRRQICVVLSHYICGKFVITANKVRNLNIHKNKHFFVPQDNRKHRQCSNNSGSSSFHLPRLHYLQEILLCNLPLYLIHIMALLFPFYRNNIIETHLPTE